MFKKSILSLILISAITLLLSPSIIYANLEDLIGSENIQKINNEKPEIPSPINNFLGNENVQLVVTMDSGVEEYAVIKTKNGRIESVSIGETENPTFYSYTTQEVIERIKTAGNPAEEFVNAFLNKEITFKGVGVKGKVKSVVMSIARVIFKLFK